MKNTPKTRTECWREKKKSGRGWIHCVYRQDIVHFNDRQKKIAHFLGDLHNLLVNCTLFSCPHNARHIMIINTLFYRNSHSLSLSNFGLLLKLWLIYGNLKHTTIWNHQFIYEICKNLWYNFSIQTKRHYSMHEFFKASKKWVSFYIVIFW